MNQRNNQFNPQNQFNQSAQFNRSPRRKNNGCMGVLVFFIVSLTAIAFLLNFWVSKDKEASNLEVIENAEQFSRISEAKLIEIMGAPEEVENWTNKTPNGNHPVKTLSYTKNGNHYEFIIHEDSVARFSIYSPKNWTRKGDDFKYHTLEKISELFEIKLGEKKHKVNNTGYAYVVSPVNDKIASFHVFGIDSKEKTFEMVKITYDTRYFE